MKIDTIREANHLLEKRRKLEEIQEEVSQRDVDFFEGDRRRSLGRNQLDPSLIDELTGYMKQAGQEWFSERILKIDQRLSDLGVEDALPDPSPDATNRKGGDDG